MIPCPVVTKTEYTCLDCTDDGVLQLLSPSGEMKEDVSLPTHAHLKDLEGTLRGILTAAKREALVVIQKWGDIE